MFLSSIGQLAGPAVLLSILSFCKLSPASKSTKAWSTFYLTTFVLYSYNPHIFRSAFLVTKNYFKEQSLQAILITVVVGSVLKYYQRKWRFSRINSIKQRYGYTEDPASWENMTVEQAQEIESNMAEWEFPRLWQFGWISDFFRTSTDPGVSRTISASGHFINDDPKIEHQRMQATIHLMTGLAAYKVKSRYSSLVIARINEHHHRYGIKINSDDVLYLMIHFGLAPVKWINRFGYRKLEPFEVHAIWVLWRELACRSGVKYIPRDLKQALEWRENFEKTFRWREDANEKMAMAMLNQVLYPIPTPLKGFVAQVFASVIDEDIVYYCQLEKLGPSPIIREVAYAIFRSCGWLIREFGLPRLSRYQRSPPGPNEHGKMTFGHTPYDTMPWWQERSFWNLWGPRALLNRLRGMPLPATEYQSEGVAIEAMGAPHRHPGTQSAIEKRVLENAKILEDAPYGYRPAIGFQANRLLPPVDGPAYGSEMNTFPAGTQTTPNSPLRFTREYERRAPAPTPLSALEKNRDEKLIDDSVAAAQTVSVAA